MKAKLYLTENREQPYYKSKAREFHTLKELNKYLRLFTRELQRTNAKGYQYLKYTITTETDKDLNIERIYRQELLVSSH